MFLFPNTVYRIPSHCSPWGRELSLTGTCCSNRAGTELSLSLQSRGARPACIGIPSTAHLCLHPRAVLQQLQCSFGSFSALSSCFGGKPSSIWIWGGAASLPACSWKIPSTAFPSLLPEGPGRVPSVPREPAPGSPAHGSHLQGSHPRVTHRGHSQVTWVTLGGHTPSSHTEVSLWGPPAVPWGHTRGHTRGLEEVSPQPPARADTAPYRPPPPPAPRS